MGQQNRFEAVKNARGGTGELAYDAFIAVICHYISRNFIVLYCFDTEIYQHWYPGNGKYWQSFRSSIRSRKGYGNWKGFIWHQGSQGNLIRLVF